MLLKDTNKLEASMSWKKNKNGNWKRPSGDKEISISIFFLLDNDVLLKIGELVRNIQFENSRKLYGLKNRQLQSNRMERLHSLHQDIQMYGICHSVLKCPITNLNSQLCDQMPRSSLHISRNQGFHIQVPSP